MTEDAVRRLDLVPLGDHAWRLCDLAADDDEEETLIAYVEQLPGGRFETVWLHGRDRVEVFDSLREVLIAGVHRLNRAARALTKPVPIPHRAPLVAR